MNKQVILKQRPVGLPDESTWETVKADIPAAKDGEVVVKQHYISLDPAMRGWMNDSKSYLPPVGIGEVMRAGSVGEVVESKHPDFQVGDYLSGWGGVQQYAATDAKGWFKVDPNLVSLPTYIGTLGMPGMTAYFGILEVGKIKEGETVLISGAAGAVGSIAGQIAKIKGCKVVGIAGGAEKCAYLKDELGFDGAIDYKNEDIQAAIKRECPKGVDVYFDNVGGDILDAALANLRMHGRVPLCGAISQYNSTEGIAGPKNYLSLLVNRGTMQGFIILDYVKDYQKAAMEMGTWMAQGKLKSREDVHEGIENFRETFLRLFSGEKLGKLVLKVMDN
ncbi:NADP-dependent oxidoreductase [Microscilla marina]|uniref:Oxidoreductase, zinc-binding dehydrogenase family protein n=1 Tax=Microscilla marina ATCC 23134 TaxID=313606 RepID=A1ZDZ1_MICM2|nr:NADP-dependent oxidoreductase [Microscilla marina]EAY31299.1 oxidoreductase, zinc-binding dehydrogenase family protein [Microscilla marina ATCC 23134]